MKDEIRGKQKIARITIDKIKDKRNNIIKRKETNLDASTAD